MFKVNQVSSVDRMKDYDRGFWANESFINIKFRPLHYSVTDEDLDNIVRQIYNSEKDILLIGSSLTELIREIIIPVSNLLKIDLPVIKHDEVEILGKRVILLPTNYKDEFSIKGTDLSLVISLNIDSLNEHILYEALTRLRIESSKLFILSTPSNKKLIQYIKDKLNKDELNYSHVALTADYPSYDRPSYICKASDIFGKDIIGNWKI